jgi:TolB-like protein/Flp pilus assembly protein TadD
MVAGNLFDELKRRNVIRAAGLYLVGAWLLVQVCATLLPVFAAPAWLMRAVVIVLAVGFVPALLVAWAFEWTPDGLKRDAEVAATDSIAPQTARRMDRLIIVVMALALGYFALDKFVLRPAVTAAPPVGEATKQARADTAVAKVQEQSIAVLPFTNLSSDPEQAYFSDGLSEDLITALSQASGLKVISRNSSFRFRGSDQDARVVGKALGVSRLLSGSVRRAGAQVRISAELTDVADGRSLWSQNYDRAYADLFELQDEITAAVAGELKTRLLAPAAGGASMMQGERPPSGNLEAYSAYLQGRFHSDRNSPADYVKSFAFYRRAIALDPAYAQAYAGLGVALGRNSSVFLGGASGRAALVEAKAAIDEALRLAPHLAYVRVAHANMLINGELRWADAEAELREAARMAPNNADVVSELAQAVAATGHVDEAVALSKRALQLDPLNAPTWYWMSIALNSLGRYAEAEQAARRAMEVQPLSDVGYAQLAFVLERSGRRGEAVAAARAMRPGVWREMALAIVSQRAGDRAAADAALQSLIAHQSEGAAYQIAQAYAARSDADQMFAWLERAWTNRDPGLRRTLYDPYLAPYRGDPRFARFVAKVGLQKP